ncbi:Uncharacterised protein [Escherichia coli]|nr:Uncharacterised protein [Escherichia coli]
METVVEVFHSYPSFLWITWCKILFIFSDQIWKTRAVLRNSITGNLKSNINQRIEQRMWKSYTANIRHIIAVCF